MTLGLPGCLRSSVSLEVKCVFCSQVCILRSSVYFEYKCVLGHQILYTYDFSNYLENIYKMFFDIFYIISQKLTKKLYFYRTTPFCLWRDGWLFAVSLSSFTVETVTNSVGLLYFIIWWLMYDKPLVNVIVYKRHYISVFCNSTYSYTGYLHTQLLIREV